mgnify:FL=1
MQNAINKIVGLIRLYYISLYRYLSINLRSIRLGSQKVTMKDCLSYGKFEGLARDLSLQEENNLSASIIQLGLKIDRSAIAWLESLSSDPHVNEVRLLAFDLCEHLKACKEPQGGDGDYSSLLRACQSTAKTQHAFNVIYASSCNDKETAMFSLTSMGYHEEQLKLIHELGVEGLKQRIKEEIDVSLYRLRCYDIEEDSGSVS